MLSLTSFSVATSSTTLIDSANAILAEGDCVGLVGRNGSGKSTLLKILAHAEDIPVENEYWIISSGRVDGLTSDSVLMVDQDVLKWSSLFHGIADEQELRQCTLQEALDWAIAEAESEAVEELEDQDAWRRLSIAADKQLHWDRARYDQTPLRLLSPGSALRAYLAVALHRPSIRLLLLDEPTNHLDLPSILWLQHSIMESGKTVIIVSHDEVFLDAIANRVWEIEDATLSCSVSKYSDFLRAKRLAREQQRRAYEEQQKRGIRMDAAAKKLRSATKAGEKYQSKDRDKMQRDFHRERAGRSGKRAVAVEKLRDLETKVERVVEHKPLRIILEPSGAGIDSSIILHSVELGYEERLPLVPITLRIDFGERVAIVGYNGIGKSTLLRTLTRKIEPLAGEVSIGCELQIGNLTQEHDSLPRDITPRDHFASITKADRYTAGTRIVSYGLDQHQVDSPIAQLNPGARARLLMAIFSIRNVNVLVLDEPTNHLDDEAITEVISSLDSYKGTVIVVSHDRYILNSLHFGRTLFMDADGLREIESVDIFVEETEDAVRRVVATSFEV